MTLKDDIIHRLQDEVIFLQSVDETKVKFDNYHYQLKGDLSESRNM